MSIEKFDQNLINPEEKKEENEMSNFEKERIERINQLAGTLKLTVQNEEAIEKEVIDKDIRFFHALTSDQEGEERFLKILANLEKEDPKKALIREIAVQAAISKQAPEEFNVRGIKDCNWNPDKGEIFCVSETFPKQKKVGFVESEDEMKKLTQKHAKEYVGQLLAMQENIDGRKIIEIIKKQFNIENDDDVYEIIEGFHSDYGDYKEDTLTILSMYEAQSKNEDEIAREFENHGKPEDIEEILKKVPDGYSKFLNTDKPEFGTMPLWMTMEYRLDAKDFRASVEGLFNKFESTVERYQDDEPHLVHGDSCPRNAFYYDSGKVEFTDWGHAGLSKNKILALVYDFGNARARVWNNKEYREAMDQAILDHFSSLDDEEAGKTVVSLGILRSQCCLAGFFENYDESKQRIEAQKKRKENTEQDVKKAFAIAGIEI